MDADVAAQLAPRGAPGWGSMTFRDVLKKWATRNADGVFVKTHSGKSMTYAQTWQRVEALSQGLQSQALRPGDTVLVRPGRRIEGLLVVLAAWCTGLNVCLAPEPLSARQITEGAVSYAPKLAVDAGLLPAGEAHNLRIMEAAASLFTIRLVGCFGDAPDGVIDLEGLQVDQAEQVEATEAPPFDLDKDCKLYTLTVGSDGKLERFTRPQMTLLSQALACAMATNLSQNTVLGTAYDLGGAHGLLVAALPTLLVGASINLFDPLDASLAARLNAWQKGDENRRLVLPSTLATHPSFLNSTAHVDGSRAWLSNGPPDHAIPDGDVLLIDCAGTAVLPATVDEDGHTLLHPLITLTSANGETVTFGTLRLDGAPQSNGELDQRLSGNGQTASLLAGRLVLNSPLTAAKDGQKAGPQISAQLAKLTETDQGKPLYQLVQGDGDAIRVGQNWVLLSTVNRALSLTGRWQDAAVFSRKDHLLGHRIEVAVEARASEEEDINLPTLETVRTMLRESGIGDAALPVRMHLVTRIPRLGGALSRGPVDVAALSGYVIDENGEPVSDMFAKQAVA